MREKYQPFLNRTAWRKTKYRRQKRLLTPLEPTLVLLIINTGKVLLYFEQGYYSSSVSDLQVQRHKNGREGKEPQTVQITSETRRWWYCDLHAKRKTWQKNRARHPVEVQLQQCKSLDLYPDHSNSTAWPQPLLLMQARLGKTQFRDHSFLRAKNSTQNERLKDHLISTGPVWDLQTGTPVFKRR